MQSDRLMAWLQQHHTNLVEATVLRLSADDSLKMQAADIVGQFFQGLVEVAMTGQMTPVFTILDHWVASRSAPTEGELTRLMPVLASIKEANNEQVRRYCQPAEAVELLNALDIIYMQAVVYLAQYEADALLMDMYAQLTAANEQLARLDKSKSDFVAVAAHELRTPITLIEGYTNMMRMTINDPMLDPLVEGVDGGVKRLREIIRDMFDVSLITLGMVDLHFQPTWLTHILEVIERGMQNTLRERNLSFLIDWASIPQQPTYGDTERLMQVFRKIVANAVKYTPDGGQITLNARELPGFVDVMIADNGIGIASDQLPHIFSMFSSMGDASLHSSGKTKFRGGGPGLGLYISKGIIEAHGGNIWAESPGYDEVACPGSTFHILIPMRSAPPDDTIAASIMNIKQD